jgi:hypothetical protein
MNRNRDKPEAIILRSEYHADFKVQNGQLRLFNSAIHGQKGQCLVNIEICSSSLIQNGLFLNYVHPGISSLSLEALVEREEDLLF